MRKNVGDPRRTRPRLAPEGRRERVLTIRLTAAERQTIWRRAALARLPVAAYVRQTALRPAAPPRSVPIVNVRSYGQFGRLANNLNQLTRLVHEGRTSPALLPCLVALLGEVRRVRRLLVGLDGGSATTGAPGGAEPQRGESAGAETCDHESASRQAQAPAAGGGTAAGEEEAAADDEEEDET
jgi:hypothetical protein